MARPRAGHWREAGRAQPLAVGAGLDAEGLVRPGAGHDPARPAAPARQARSRARAGPRAARGVLPCRGSRPGAAAFALFGEGRRYNRAGGSRPGMLARTLTEPNAPRSALWADDLFGRGITLPNGPLGIQNTKSSFPTRLPPFAVSSGPHRFTNLAAEPGRNRNPAATARQTYPSCLLPFLRWPRSGPGNEQLPVIGKTDPP